MSFSAAELSEWSSGSWESSIPDHISGFSKDSRSIEAGQIYLALKGESFDGHEFVEAAFAKGAVATIVSREWDATGVDGPLLRVDDTGKALCEIANGYRFKVDPMIVAVTGSAGKSTVKELITAMLSVKAPTASTKGNWNNQIGLPMSMLSMSDDTRYGVFEVGTNHPGEIAELCEILRPDWGVITNVGPAHIEFFGSLNAIAEEKASLFKSLSDEGTAVVSKNSECLDLLESSISCRTLSVSLCGDADYVCTEYDATAGTASLKETSSGEIFSFVCPQPGEHHVSNVLQAVAVARGQGLAWDDISTALAGYEPLPMRWAVNDIDGVTVINDAYNANPMSMRASLAAFDELSCDGGKWLVLGDMLELGDVEKDEHLALGEFIGESEWSGVVYVGALGDYIARGADAAGFSAGRIFTCHDNTHAASILKENLVSGDAVLLKGSRGIKLEEVLEQYSKG